MGDIFDQVTAKSQGDIFDSILPPTPKTAAQTLPSFTSPHDVLEFGRSAENADEYTDPKDQELFKNIFSQPEPPELAQLHQAALNEKNSPSWWQKHFGHTPALDAYSKARYAYEDQLQQQFDTKRIFQTAGPMHPSLGGVQAPNPIFVDQANKIAQEQGETQFYRDNSLPAYISQHPAKAIYKTTARMISPVGGPEEASGAEGYYPLVHGTYRAATAPNLQESLKGGTEAMQGLGETLTPLQYTMAGIQPGTLIKYTVGSELGAGLAQDAAERAGLSPEAQDFLSATSGIIGGLALGLHEHLNRPVNSGLAPAPDNTPISEKAHAATANGVAPLRPSTVEDGLIKGPLPDRFKPITPDGGGFLGLGENSGDIFDKVSGQGELFPDRRTTDRSELDRRQDLETRKYLASLQTPEEKDAEIARIRKEQRMAPLTGLPNSKALSEAGLEESHPHVGFADIDDFKGANTAIGHNAVDQQVLPTLGRLFQDAVKKEPEGSIYVFQKTSGKAGDEFVLRSDDPDRISRVVDRVNDAFSNTTFESQSGVWKGTGLSHGIADDIDAAELASHDDKASRKALGLRTGARDIPPEDDSSSSGVAASRAAYQSRFTEYVSQKTSPEVATRYSSLLNDFFSRVPDNSTLNFTPAEIDTYKTRRVQEGASPETIASELKAVTDFKKWAVQDFAGSVIGPAVAASKTFQARMGKRLPSPQRRFGNNGEFVPHFRAEDNTTKSTARDGSETPYSNSRNPSSSIPEQSPASANPYYKSNRKNLQAKYENYLASQGSSATANRYSYALERFFSKLPENSNITDVKPSDIENYGRQLQAEGFADKTIKFELAAVRGFRNWVAGKQSKQVQDSTQPPKSAVSSRIEKAKARYTPEKLAALRDAYEEDRQDRTLAALSEYGRVSSDIRDLEAKLDLANRAEQKGFTRGALTPEKRAKIEKALTAARGRADDAFKSHVKGLTDDEANSLIQDIEKPAYKQIGQALQLRKLLKDDPVVRILKQALDEDMSQPGLSLESRARVSEILRDNNVGVRLTKGPEGQRSRIYDKLGYTTSPEQAFKLLKYPPRGPNAQEIWDRVKAARSYAAEMAASETDPKRKAFYERISERNDTTAKPSEKAEAQARLSNLEYQYSKETDIYQKAKLSRSMEKLKTVLPTLSDVAPPAPKHEFKYNPILVNPKVKGTSQLSTSEFFHADLPGELHEINLKNLAAILGKGQIWSKTGELTADQKSLLKNAGSDEVRRAYRAQFVREHVQQLHDEAVSSVKAKIEQVRRIKEIRGIPADHLTPLETKLAAIVEEQQRGQTFTPAGMLETPQRSSQPEKPPPHARFENPQTDRLRGVGNEDQSRIEGSQAEQAIKPTLTPVEASIHMRVKGLEEELSKIDPSVTPSLEKIRKAAEEVGSSREYKYRLYENGLATLKKALAKGDPWALRRAIDAVRRSNEIGTLGPSARNLTPDEERDTNRDYLNRVLNKYESMTDLRLAAFRDSLDDVTMRRLLDEANDPGLSARYAKLVSKSESRDPIVEMGDRIVNGIRISPRDAAGDIIRNAQGDAKWGAEAQRQALEPFRARFKSMSIGESVDWQDAAEHGNWAFFRDPDELKAAQILNKKWAEYGQKLVDVGALDTFIENYMPRIAKNVGKGTAFMRELDSRKPFGPDVKSPGFLRKRLYDTYRQFLDAGNQPVTWDPLEMNLIRMAQVEEFLATHEAKQGLIDGGLAKFYRDGQQPMGWTKYSHPLFEAAARDKQSGALSIFGHYYGPLEVTKAFDNFLARSAFNEPGVLGTALRTARTTNNIANQIRLIGPGFHFNQIAFQTVLTHVTNAMLELTSGQAKLAAKSPLTYSKAPLAPIQMFLTGRKVMAEAASLATMTKYSSTIDAARIVGGFFKADRMYVNQEPSKFLTIPSVLRDGWKTIAEKDFKTSKRIQAAAKLPMDVIKAASDKAGYFIQQYYVPTMKAGIWHGMVAQINEQMGPNPDPMAYRRSLNLAWDSLDNRAGQMITERRLWNPVVRDIVNATIGFPGWNIGTQLEIGGGALDVGSKSGRILLDRAIAKFNGKAGTGESAQLSQRSAYLIGITSTVMLAGAVAMYLRTGKMPEKLDDYIYVPDVNGENRMYMKNYISDEVGFFRRPGDTTVHKANYALQTAYELFWANADYYGREIQHKGDSPWDRTKEVGTYLGHSLTPFAIQNYQNADSKGMSPSAKIAAAFGYMPAPKWAGQSPAERLASELAEGSFHSGPRTTADFNRQQAVTSLRRKFEQKQIDSSAIAKAALPGAGGDIFDTIGAPATPSIRPSDVTHILETAGKADLIKYTDRLDINDALNVWDKANPEEKKQLFPTIIKRYQATFQHHTPEEQADLRNRVTRILTSLPKQPSQ
jgi:GGDEF domain-containing protein/site-specific recombinase XerC